MTGTKQEQGGCDLLLLGAYLAHDGDHLAHHGGQSDEDRGLVFTAGTGAPINPSNIRQRTFANLLKKAGLRKIRFHDLRRTCATLMLSTNLLPKIVQEMLGHATIAITLERYSHFLPAMSGDTVLEMDEISS